MVQVETKKVSREVFSAFQNLNIDLSALCNPSLDLLIKYLLPVHSLIACSMHIFSRDYHGNLETAKSITGVGAGKRVWWIFNNGFVRSKYRILENETKKVRIKRSSRTHTIEYQLKVSSVHLF